MDEKTGSVLPVLSDKWCSCSKDDINVRASTLRVSRTYYIIDFALPEDALRIKRASNTRLKVSLKLKKIYKHTIINKI